ncbi:hypothetical protein TNCV_2379161 [Trichonephila clavipes]|uniref:Uncharacterized protein n=1 Tax=Trichonephila clavipes TaxID=2585209 RepID=A0A8X6V0N7_TRICX|nr:hypothetical protein TNCV_2379161 [Trichonephila clavipes]
MVELLRNHIQENISSLFVCYGCLEGYENQLGHECMTYSNEQRISEYGDLAILNMDWDKLVADFVNQSIRMVNYMKMGKPRAEYLRNPTLVDFEVNFLWHGRGKCPLRVTSYGYAMNVM